MKSGGISTIRFGKGPHGGRGEVCGRRGGLRVVDRAAVDATPLGSPVEEAAMGRGSPLSPRHSGARSGPSLEHSLLDNGQTYRLIGQFQDSPRQTVSERALSSLVAHNMRLVAKEVARRYPSGPVEREDLMQEGVEGLVEDARRFDVSLGNRFSTYAVYWIRQRIRRALLHGGRPVRLPAEVEAEIIHFLRREDGPSEEMTAARRRELELAEARASSPVSMEDEPSFGDSEGGRPLGDVLADEEDVEDVVFHSSGGVVRGEIDEALQSLDERKRLVVEYRFGLGGASSEAGGPGPLTLVQTGEVLGLSHEGVRKIEKDAMAELGSLMGASPERLDSRRGAAAARRRSAGEIPEEAPEITKVLS